MSLRILEFFSGLGGWRYAFEGRGEVLAAFDVSPAANATYALNHGHEPLPRELATLPFAEIAAQGADTWALSPPCQPYCRMGKHQDLADPRSRAFLRLMDALEAVPPQHLVLENVEGFLGSEGHSLLVARLKAQGFRWRELRLCPNHFGLPNLRPRVFLAASRQNLSQEPPPEQEAPPLTEFLDPDPDPALFLDAEALRHYPGLDLAHPEDRRSACFIGGYGQRFVGSGSFLVSPKGIRRFSPGEVARLLGLPASFRFPESLSREKRYKLLGNGLSIPVARWVAGLIS